jgi:6-pyruvoyl-tetrahydropterin synthase-like protein
MRKSSFGSLLAVSIIAVIFLSPLMRPGYFEGHETAQKTLFRRVQLDVNVKAGNIPPRWAPDFAGGAGTAFFNYYHPFFLYIGECFHLAGFSFPSAIYLTIAFLTFIAGMGMYLFTRMLWGDTAGIIAAAGYLLFPYRICQLYVRGAYAEFSAGAVLPWVFWAVTHYLTTGDRRYGVASGVTSAILLISHNSIALLAGPVLFAWVTVFSWKHVTFKRYMAGLIWLGSGLVGAAYYWLPAILEISSVRIGLMRENYFHVSNHFSYIHQLLGDAWGYGTSQFGPDDSMPVQISAILLWCAAMTAVLLWRKSGPTGRYVRFWVCVSLVYIGLNLPVSLPVWTSIPGLSFSQFPWRSLTIVALPVSLLSAVFFCRLIPGNMKGLMGWILPVLILSAYSGRYIRASAYAHLESVDLSREAIRTAWETTTASCEYVPGKFKLNREGYPGNCAWIESGKGTIESVSENAESILLHLRTEETVSVRFHRAFFPGWTVNIDGVYHQPGIDKDGFIVTSVPVGRHDVSVCLQETPLRKISNSISIVFLIWILGVFSATFFPGRSREENLSVKM